MRFRRRLSGERTICRFGTCVPCDCPSGSQCTLPSGDCEKAPCTGNDDCGSQVCSEGDVEPVWYPVNAVVKMCVQTGSVCSRMYLFRLRWTDRGLQRLPMRSSSMSRTDICIRTRQYRLRACAARRRFHELARGRTSNDSGDRWYLVRPDSPTKW